MGAYRKKRNSLALRGNTKYNLATPFLANVHSIGDHDNCGLFYVCKALNPSKLKINKELKNSKWFTKEDLNINSIPEDVKNHCLKAFEVFYSMKDS